MPVSLSSPVRMQGVVVKGFGRGSKQLGIPTANMDAKAVLNLELEPGIYFGFARVNNDLIHKMVVSVGWNPFYRNEFKSVETHILHEFEQDFYGQTLRIVITSYIREERNYDSLDALIADIRNDIAVAHAHLDLPESLVHRQDDFITRELDENERTSDEKT